MALLTLALQWTLVHEHEQPTVFPLLCFPSAFIRIRLTTRFKQHLMAPLKSAGGRGLWLRAECGEGSRLPDLLHRQEKPPLSLLLFPTRRTTAAPRAPPRERRDASALASMQVVWPAGFGQPRAEQSTPAVLSPPRGRAPDAGTPPVRSPVRPEIASPPLSTPAPRKPSSELSTN